MAMKLLKEEITKSVNNELNRANAQFRLIPNSYAVILEELEESKERWKIWKLWRAYGRNQGKKRRYLRKK